MHIALFTENSHRGGLDTFLATLINHWPHPDDRLTLLCNANHPGLADIEARLERPCRIIGHAMAMQWDWMNRFERLPVIGRLRRPLSPFLRYPFFAAYLARLRGLLDGLDADRLMVVNGGYPGGDSCRAATIAWGRRQPENRAVHCFHSMAIAPRPWERWIENRIDRAVARHALAFVSVSRACIDSLALRPGLALARNVSHVPNGIADQGSGADEAAAVRRGLGIAADAPLCAMIGSYEAHKGHGFLFDAFHRVVDALPDARLVVCGHGYAGEVARVERLRDEAGLGGSVCLEGFRNDVPGLLAAADVLLLPSQSFEAFGLAIVEAWAQETPVVATRMGGIGEVMGADDEGGFCVAPDDADAFARHTLALLRDPALRAEKGAGGARRYRARFTARRMAEDYAALIRGTARAAPATALKPDGLHPTTGREAEPRRSAGSAAIGDP